MNDKKVMTRAEIINKILECAKKLDKQPGPSYILMSEEDYKAKLEVYNIMAKNKLIKKEIKKVSILEMVIEAGRQLDEVNASDKNRSIHLTLGNYKRLCKELDVKYCKWVDRFTIVVKIKK